MQFGNWVPISKSFVNELPSNRPFTKLEAIYSMQVDIDNNNVFTISGAANRWGGPEVKLDVF